MINRVFIFLLILVFAFPLCTSAQLSENAINELASQHVEKWSAYLNLSKYRKAELRKVWKNHELNKSIILRRTNDIKDRLHEENQNFLSSLSAIFTPNELNVYQTVESLQIEDDKNYLASLVSAISTDNAFIEAYTDLQYNEIYPFMISVRMELEESILKSDKIALDSIREEVLEHYDKCLVTCLSGHHNQADLFEDFDEFIIVALNKDLNDDQSGLSQLIRLTRKYEDAIHEVYIRHKQKIDYWDKKSKEIKDQYILPSYNKSLLDLQKRNGLSTIKHMETDAIFLLLDPYNRSSSRRLFNLGLYNGL